MVKVACFDRLSQVLILNGFAVGLSKLGTATRIRVRAGEEHGLRGSNRLYTGKSSIEYPFGQVPFWYRMWEEVGLCRSSITAPPGRASRLGFAAVLPSGFLVFLLEAIS